MRVHISQMYMRPCEFPFSHIFQRWLSGALSEQMAAQCLSDYPDFELIFRMSSKARLASPEILGPTVFKKTKDVEYSIFLPFFPWDVSSPNTLRRPLELLLESIATVLTRLGVDASEVDRMSTEWIDHILATPEMLQPDALRSQEIIPENAGYPDAPCEEALKRYEKQSELVLQWSAETIEEFDAMSDLEDLLREEMSSKHDIDGNDFGAGEMNIYIYSTAPKAAFKEAKRIVAHHGMMDGLRVGYRRSMEDDYIPLWPKDLKAFEVK